MHSPPLKRSVTAPHNHVPPVTITPKTLVSYTPRSLHRHRSASPNPRPRTHSPDSPRPLELLYHKSVSLGRSSSHSPTPGTGASSQSSGLHVPVCEEFDAGISGLHVQVTEPDTSSFGLQAPISEESEAGSSSLGRVYASTETSPDSSEILQTAPVIVGRDYLGILQQPDYHSNTSSQSCLSFYVPPTFGADRLESENSELSQLTLTESDESTAQDTPRYIAAEIQKISRSAPGGNTPDFQFPILETKNLKPRISRAPDLSITPGDFERKAVIGDPDPSFHRSHNSPVTGEPLGQVILEQVGSFGVHHLRNDSLGELPHISTIEALPSPPALSLRELSQGGTPSPGLVSMPGVITTPSIVVASGEVTPSTVILPGEYVRRRHSGSALRSQGHRDFGVSLQIRDHVPYPLPLGVMIEARVTSDRPPNTPESPFTLISREQTKVRGRAQDSPSPLVTFLSAVSPVESHCNVLMRPKPPGKENPHGILPVPSLRTTAMCFMNACGDQTIWLPETDVPTNDLPLHMAELIREGSPCLRSVQEIIDRDDQNILSLAS